MTTALNLGGIAVLGSHPRTVMLAPFDDLKWKIYACSPHNVEHRTLPRVDEWFEVHKPIQDKTRSYRYLRALESMGCPVWMRDKENMGCFPNAQEYDEHRLKSIFGPFTFTSSIAFMLAKAIDDCTKLNLTQIGIWGVMQQSETEYAYQRPGIQNLIWRAVERGITVYAPEESRLFEPMPEIF